ncbi:centrosomal protein of 120 kDa-like isoform X2 [Lineus longissimus]|uniref:centrosomal protein of 120 kDa-like isoform X2 n=1 Tax=Lineus longissimus TaxID=88925 RepID=UPI002B4EE76B
MVGKDRFLVVVSVLEGRKFPKRPKHKLIAEAKFDGELLATDPVDHNEEPDFTQEIAWELDKKGLSQHRLQRSSIKVQYYAVDVQSTMREAIGYVMLDLRSATNTQTAKWYPLLHGKYSRSKPEVRLGIYLDEDKNIQPAGFKARAAPARPGTLHESPSTSESIHGVDPKLLKPVLNESEGFYQLGPVEKSTENFILSVTISFASNLPQLIPASQPLPLSGNGYFFYYSLLGNDITNETFFDLLNPNFPPERASVKVKSNSDFLRAFFEQQPGIQVHLCCGDQSLGSCEVPLNTLLKKGSTEIFMKPVLLEGAFEMAPPARVKSLLPAYPEEMMPTVGLSVMLRMEEQYMGQVPEAITPTKTTPTKEPHSPPQRLEKPAEKKKSKTPPPDSYTDEFDTNTEGTENAVSNIPEESQERKNAKAKKESKKKQEAPRQSSPGLGNLKPVPITEQGGNSHSSSNPQYQVPPQTHHFNFSIDLKTIKNLDTTVPLNVFMRYVYPFFGSSAPVITHPTIEVQRGMEVSLPQSFCAFDFATSMQQLEDTFHRVPLIVEVYDRDRAKGLDTLLGVAQLPLPNIIEAEKARVACPNGALGWRQVFGDVVSIMAADGQSRKVGDLSCSMTLEDLGAISSRHVTFPTSESSNAYSLSAATQQQPQPAPSKEPRETQEYQAALELEMWKEAQENLFSNRLKEKEFQHMRALADEWKRRDRERELLVKKKIAEYTQLEQQLKKTISEFEKRERLLGSNEQEVSRLRGDLEREHERKILEMREASRRMKDDCEHLVQLERLKVNDLQEQISRLRSQLDEADKKYQGLDREFMVYREQQSSKPEVRLQSEINLLTLEKVELERKIDSVTKSKIHYKQQWGRALKELARLKQKEQDHAKAELLKQQHELEHMRLRYLAAEEKEVVKTDMKELEDIKNELNKLKEQEAQRKDADSPTKGQTDLDVSYDDHIARLIEERDTLLRTGVYSSEDRIIAELDRQIREAIATSKTIN